MLSALGAIGNFVSRLFGGGHRSEIKVGGNVKGSILQAGEGNIAMGPVQSVEVSTGEQALEELRSAIKELGLSGEQQALIEADLGEIGTELASPTPSRERVGTTLQTLVEKLKMANIAIEEGGKLGSALLPLAQIAGKAIEGLPGL